MGSKGSNSMSELSELFARDPCQLSDQDLGVIVERLRQHMAQHELGAPKVPKAPKPKSSKTIDALKDLGLG